MAELVEAALVISLTRATERRERVGKEFAKAGLSLRFFDGVDGQKHFDTLLLRTDEARWRRNMGSPVNAGHLGCYASHVQLWETIGKEADKIYLVCEDDVTFGPDIKTAIATALELQDQWDICRFSALRAKGRIAQRSQNGFSLNAYWGPFTGNACYLIKSETARRIAPRFWPITCAHDHELNRFFDHDVRLFGLEPFAAKPKDLGQSFITGQSKTNTEKFPKLKRLPYYSRKMISHGQRALWLARNGFLFNR